MRTPLLLALICTLTTQLYAQEASTMTIEDQAAHRILNKQENTMLRPEGASMATGARLVLFQPKVWACLTWTFTGNQKDGFVLRNHYTDRSFSCPKVAEDGGFEQVDEAKGGRWQFTANEDGSWRISPAGSDLVLTATSTTGPVVLKPWKGIAAQSWLLESPAKN